jgi:CelD/BcsL family acetyltransferase involved in cellulose biosynthesis
VASAHPRVPPYFHHIVGGRAGWTPDNPLKDYSLPFSMLDECGGQKRYLCRRKTNPMSRYHILHLANVAELRSAAANWDDLWRRSDVTMPTKRAELLAGWLEQFASGSEFRAIVVEEGGRWVAALPLISQRFAKILTAGSLPRNPWLPCGDLLLDPLGETDAVLEALLSGAADLPWALLWLNYATLDAPYWKALSAACYRRRIPVVEHVRYKVARIEIAESWDAFTKSLSRTYRRETRRVERHLQSLGKVQFTMHSQLAPEEVPLWMERVFRVEDLSWKGAAGSSVLRVPGMSDFFVKQARQLARLGQLEIAFLELEGRPIASLFGFSAKGVYHGHKIGYDPQYGQYSPGRLLLWKVLERMHTDAGWKCMDCIGPLSEATSHWRPSTYTIGRLVLAPRRLVGRIALQAYRHVWPKIRWLRGTAKGGVQESSPTAQTDPATAPAHGNEDVIADPHVRPRTADSRDSSPVGEVHSLDPELAATVRRWAANG